jgi:[protein-PII] uridylyltransferase
VIDLAVLSRPAGAGESVAHTLASRSADVEDLVRNAWSKTLQPVSGVALAAVGGFGRGELFPHSDVDLLVVVESEAQIAPMREPLSAFLQKLWDAELRPSHAVQTVAYCASEHEDNVELSISLLDRRFLAGDPAMYKWLEEKFGAFAAKRRATLARWLAAMTEARRGKFQNTIYHLEPDLKNSPGALRDLQTVRWLAALRQQSVEVSASFEFLAGLRIRLHEIAGRDHNVLNFDAQESIAPDSAALMRDYFRHARAVDREALRALESATAVPGNLLGRFHDWRSRLSTTEFTVSRDRVFLREHSRPAGLRLFEFAARHELKLAADTVDRLAHMQPQTTWEDWKALLGTPKPSFGLRAMQSSDALAAVLPEWRRIESLVVRDFYHRYTVDEHTLVAITSLESIRDARFAGLFGEIPDPWIVRFALLLHDIGKGSGTDHVTESAAIAGEVLERLNAPEEDRAAVEFLVRNHLELSSVMTARDLEDDATSLLLAARVETVERLKQLTMITYADITAVNPDAMTPWRLEQLWRAYLAGYRALTAGLYSERIHYPQGDARAAFLEGLPMRYLRTHSQAQIDSHFELAKQLESRPVAIEITQERRIYCLTLLTRDRPGLFAAIAGAISAFGLNILKAEAFSNGQGVIVDTFTFADDKRTLELNPSEVDRLRGIVRRVAEGRQDAAQLLRARPKPLLPSRQARLKPSVTLSNDASDAATLIEIVAEDRPGLLYDLSRAIASAECNIEVVLIDTEAHKALDVFYVTADGGKLDPARSAKLQDALRAACSGDSQ